MNGIYKEILQQLRKGLPLVQATVIRTMGSTPQKPGSAAIFGKKGLLAGTVGGGTLEGEVHDLAGRVLISGISDHYYFDLDTAPEEEGAICGGESVVLIDAKPGKHLKAFEAMEQSLAMRKGGYLLTVVRRANNQGCAIERYWIEGDHPHAPFGKLDPLLQESVSGVISAKERAWFSEVPIPPSIRAQFEGVFLESIHPLPHLVIAGGGHVGKALAHLGKLLEFEVTVIDDRPEYANKENIPDADHLLVSDFGKAMGALNGGPDTYIAIVTRGHKHDTEALRPCIGKELAYVGMIGSSHKVWVIKQRFLEEGWATPESWSRIHSPIGLAIGSESVQEIALSIAAQLVSVRSQKHRHHAG